MSKPAPRSSAPYLSAMLLALFGGCAVPKDDTAAPDTAPDPDAPAVASVTKVLCSKQQSAGELWSFTVTVTDPQGPNTVDGGVAHAIDGADTELAAYEFPCDNKGTCYGSFREVYDGVGCALGGELVLRMVVTDSDGHESAPYDYLTTPFG